MPVMGSEPDEKKEKSVVTLKQALKFRRVVATISLCLAWHMLSVTPAAAQNRAANDNNRAANDNRRAANDNYQRQQAMEQQQRQQQQQAQQRQQQQQLQQQAQQRQQQQQLQQQQAQRQQQTQVLQQQQQQRARDQAAQAQSQARQAQTVQQQKNAQLQQQNRRVQDMARTREEQQRQQQQQRLAFQKNMLDRQRLMQTQQQNANRAKLQAANTLRNKQIQEAKRLPTPGEIQKGFTGRTTADGRALVKFKNKILVVPASRINGLSARQARDKQIRNSRMTADQQQATRMRLQRIGSSGGSGAGGGSGSGGNPPSKPAVQARIASAKTVLDRTGCGPGVSVGGAAPRFSANDDCGRSKTDADGRKIPPWELTTAKQKAHYQKAVSTASGSEKKVLMLGKNPDYRAAARNSNAELFHLHGAEWQAQERNARDSLKAKLGRAATESEVKDEVFAKANLPVLVKHTDAGNRIVLASPYEDMVAEEDSYSYREIAFLKDKGYVLSSDGLEMIPGPPKRP